MRKITTLLTLSSGLLLGACTSSPQLSSDAPIVYLNTHIGFSEDSYAYAQPHMMCEIDERLVADIIDKAARQNIRVEPLSELGDIQVSSNLLTIDIAQLGAKQSSSKAYVNKQAAPELAINARYFERQPGEFQPLSHSDHCSEVITAQQSVQGKSGRSGVSHSTASMADVCRGLKSCSRRLSGDLAQWLSAELVNK